MSFIIRNKTAGAIPLIDLGLTVPASADYDLIPEDPRQIATSADLIAQVIAGNIVVLDPLDGVTELSAAISQDIVEVHNDPHYRIRGGTLNQLDDVNTAGAVQNDVLSLNGSGIYVAITPDDLVGNASNTVNQQISDLLVDGTSTTVTRTGSPLTAIQIDVDDDFLKNTGDVLDSGTLQIASGAALDLPTGSSLTIAGDVTAATIATPVGGFDGNTDIVNKFYVDSLAAGLDWKESATAGTVSSIISGSPAAVYVPAGGAGGSGQFTGVDLTSDAIFDGAPTITGGFQVGDRILIKDQADPKQNGIYVVTTAGSAGVIERAHDQDGTPTSEVSGGNTVFVENGTTQESTIWSVIWDGDVTLNTDPVDWSQTGATTDLLAGQGLNSVANTFNLDISTLSTTATIASGDFLAFDDITGVSGTTDTSKTTVANFLADLDIVNGITTNGMIIRSADDTYSTISIVSSTLDDRVGIEVLNGNGTAGNPTVGLDIENLPYITSGSPAGVISTSDRVPVYDVDQDRNVYYSVSDIAGALSSTNSFETWAPGAGATGTAAVADSGTDTMSAIAGPGIAVAVANDPESITWSLDLSTVPSGGSPNVVDVTDELVINNGGSTVTVTVQEFIDALGLAGDELAKISANDTTAGYLNGKIVAGTYTTLTENNDGGNETLTIDTDPSTINITDLGDVTGVPSPGDVLVYGGSPGVWTPQAPSDHFDVCTLDAGSTGTLDVTDSIAVCDGGSSVRFTFSEVFETLDVVAGVTGTGMIIKTSGSPTDGYATRSIVAAGTGAGDGLVVTDGDGIAGNPTVELDIDGTPAAGENLASNDQFVVYNASATANETLTGQEVADGVINILNLTGLSIKTIGGSGSPGEQQLFITDAARSKDLSVTEFTVAFSENNVGNSDWLEVGSATDATSGYVIPYNATLVRASAHTSSSSSAKTIDLYVDGTATAPLVTIPSGGGSESEITNGTLNIDVAAGQKIRLRGGATGGQIGDVVASLWFRWRS